ncbi:TetR/AcrR family transcriptional regulator [Mesorhizobium sp. LHD-90]|uniref:TetR/AcrR family transcriptional regulator n=1 Tax=Mesorhizobium sp. LHD-90 TaxID=3071414 RepID=UPI0027DF45EE|nr:TetR/AcrR family transcriptional regulator [Mesorhizobium sp. LHD-90]MDQ6437370.1 TetR/AcrR family transcriptional regulator [Mesorhizobium sp. LHD-90]
MFSSPSNQDEDRRAGPTGNLKATREDWLNVALEAMASEGVEAVRILSLGQRLGVSRSSFYWYFKSRQDLLDQLLDYWRNRNTRVIVERASRSADTITEGVLNVFECWVDETLFDPRLDFAIRAWARQSPDVHRTVDEADEMRVDAIRDMFQRHGFEEKEAFVRARVLYFVQIGYYSLEIVESMNSRLSLVPSYVKTHTGKDPTQREMDTFAEFAQRVTARDGG